MTDLGEVKGYISRRGSGTAESEAPIHFWKQNSDKWSELNSSLTARRHLEAEKGMVPI